jgi:hypothetical protein
MLFDTKAHMLSFRNVLTVFPAGNFAFSKGKSRFSVGKFAFSVGKTHFPLGRLRFSVGKIGFSQGFLAFSQRFLRFSEGRIGVSVGKNGGFRREKPVSQAKKTRFLRFLLARVPNGPYFWRPSIKPKRGRWPHTIRRVFPTTLTCNMTLLPRLH